MTRFLKHAGTVLRTVNGKKKPEPKPEDGKLDMYYRQGITRRQERQSITLPTLKWGDKP